MGFRQRQAAAHKNSAASSAPDSVHALFTTDIRDEEGRARWKRAVQAQEEEQALLHRTVVDAKRQHLELQYERVAKQRAFIRREKRKLLLQHALLSSERERFEASRSSDWFCLAAFPSASERRVTLDVGGQLFELSAATAAKDPASLLAALVQDDSPLSVSERGCFRVDRDWWLFRHILRFLRDGVLSTDPKLLRELYVESEFWRFESLQKAIEVKNMELWQPRQSCEVEHKRVKDRKSSLLARGKAAVAETKEEASEAGAEDPGEWWQAPPAWWGVPAADKASRNDTKDSKKEAKGGLLANAFRKKKFALGGKKTAGFASKLAAKKKSAEQRDDKDNKDDDTDKDSEAWWRSTKYKGTDYTDILAKEKHKTSSDEHVEGFTPRSPLVVHNTWTTTTSNE